MQVSTVIELKWYSEPDNDREEPHLVDVIVSAEVNTTQYSLSLAGPVDAKRIGGRPVRLYEEQLKAAEEAILDEAAEQLYRAEKDAEEAKRWDDERDGLPFEKELR